MAMPKQPKAIRIRENCYRIQCLDCGTGINVPKSEKDEPSLCVRCGSRRHLARLSEVYGG